MNYYVVIIPNEVAICLEPSLSDLNTNRYNSLLKDGHNVNPVDVPSHKSYFNQGAILDVTEGYKYAPYVNARTMAIFKKHLKEDAQFLKVGKIKTEDYFLFNVTKSIHCMDMVLSRYTKFSTGKLSEPSSIALVKRSVPEDCLLFRMAEYPKLLIASEQFTEIIKENRITGIGFTVLDFLLSNYIEGDAIPGLPITNQ